MKKSMKLLFSGAILSLVLISLIATPVLAGTASANNATYTKTVRNYRVNIDQTIDISTAGSDFLTAVENILPSDIANELQGARYIQI